VPDDPFSDLDGPRPRSRAEQIGDRLAERDRVDPEEPPRRPEPRRPRNRYAWVVGIALFMGIVALYLTTARPNSGEAVRGPQPATTLAAFAAPLARGQLAGDANVCQRAPCPDGAGRMPACELRSDQVLNSCALRERPTVLTFVVTQGTDCEPQVDRVERMRRDFPGVNFAVVLSGLESAEAKQLVRRRGWTLPVGLDPDGAVVNLYGIGVCPTTVFSGRDGKVTSTALGNLTEDELSRRVRRLRAR
jgi:hypothetical protein